MEPTYAPTEGEQMNDRMRLVAAVALIALGAVACADPSGPATNPASPTPTEPPTDLESAQAAWTTADVGSYELHITTMCFCPNEEYRIVVDEEGNPNRDAPTEYLPETVEDLHAIIADAVDADEVDVTYDDVGVPERIYIDTWENAVDDEMTYEIGFTDLP